MGAKILSSTFSFREMVKSNQTESGTPAGIWSETNRSEPRTKVRISTPIHAE